MPPIYEDVSQMIDPDPKGREALKDQLSGTASIEDEKASIELSNSVAEIIHSTIHSNGWMAKAARIAGFYDPLYVGRTCIPYGAVVATGFAIYFGAPKMYIGFLFALAVGLFIICNPHQILSRWLAWQTRAFLFGDDFFLTVGIMTKVTTGRWNLLLASLVWVAFTALIAFLMNSRWLMAQNLLMSDVVRTAIVKCKDTNGMDRWRDIGKTETRTVLFELGLPVLDKVLTIFAMPVWLCGYYRIAMDLEKLNKTITNQANKIVELERNAKIDADTIAEMESELEKGEHAQEIETLVKRGNNLSFQLQESKKREVALQKRIEELEVLVRDQKALTPEEQLRQTICNLRDTIKEDGKPMSVNDIHAELAARGIKVSTGKIGQICKEYRELKEAMDE